jgi:hypothetical protein
MGFYRGEEISSLFFLRLLEFFNYSALSFDGPNEEFVRVQCFEEIRFLPGISVDDRWV